MSSISLTPYQLVAPLISLVAVVYAWNLVMRQKKTVWEACFWTLFWGAVAVIALSPSILTYLSAVTGIVNHENAAIVTAIGILFFMVFYIVVRIEEIEQRQARIVREMALKEAGLPEKK